MAVVVVARITSRVDVVRAVVRATVPRDERGASVFVPGCDAIGVDVRATTFVGATSMVVAERLTVLESRLLVAPRADVATDLFVVARVVVLGVERSFRIRPGVTVSDASRRTAARTASTMSSAWAP